MRYTIAWPLVFACAIGLSACQIKTDRTEPHSAPLILQSHIVSDDQTTMAVADNILDHVREVSQEALCLTGDLKIAVFDEQSSGEYRPGETVPADDYPIQIIWPFEPLADDYALNFDDPVDFLTRPHSPNHTLAHELGHLIFTVHLADGKVTRGGYGSAAPDWLDEAAAILFDSPATRALRRDMFRKTVRDGRAFSLKSLQSLERVPPDFRLSMPKPKPEEAASPAVTVNPRTGIASPVEEDRLWLPDYYAQIDTLLLYLDQTGTPDNPCLLDAFVRGRALEDQIDQADYSDWLVAWADSGKDRSQSSLAD